MIGTTVNERESDGETLKELTRRECRRGLGMRYRIVLRDRGSWRRMDTHNSNWRSDADDGESGSLTSGRNGEPPQASALAVAISFLYILVLH